MKKFLFLLIILGCAVYWGMSQGDDLSRQAKASHGGAVSAPTPRPVPAPRLGIGCLFPPDVV